MACADVLSPGLFDSLSPDLLTFSPPAAFDRRSAKRQKTACVDPDLLEMSGYYYTPVSSSGQYYNFENNPRQTPTTQSHDTFEAFAAEFYALPSGQQSQSYVAYPRGFQNMQHAQHYQYSMPIPAPQLQPQQQQWTQQMFAESVTPGPSRMTAFPQYSDPIDFDTELSMRQPTRTSLGYLSPPMSRPRISRATSVADSIASSVPSVQTDFSRGASPNATEMSRWGNRNSDNSWSCAYPGCTSKSTFNRGCDLRKHYKRHTKSLYCRHDGCPQATEGGFSSKKDRARHEAKHNPSIICEWDGCERLFSRQDNMKDHVRRVHRRRMI